MGSAVLDIFNHFRTILCMCPECSHIMRLSDLHLRSRGRAPRTWLDSYEAKDKKLGDEKDKFEEEKKALQMQARDEGQRTARRRVKKTMSREMAKLRFDPYDIKPILHPVDFAVFNGVHEDAVRDVLLMSKRTGNPHLARLHKDVEHAIKSKSYDWKTVRVSPEGNISFE